MDVHIFDAEHLELNATVVLWPQNIYPIFDQSDEVKNMNKYQGIDIHSNEYQIYKLLSFLLEGLSVHTCFCR